MQNRAVAIALVSTVMGIASALAASPAAQWATPADAAALAGSGMSLLHAVAIAEDQAFPNGKPHGRAVEARFDGAAKRFHVTLVANDQVIEAEIGAGTADHVTLGDPKPVAALDAAERQSWGALKPTAVDLPDAIAAAEERGGFAVDAGLAQQTGQPRYRVDIVVDGKLQTVLVDPATAKIAVAAAAPSPTPAAPPPAVPAPGPKK
jgi:hypothetical protein